MDEMYGQLQSAGDYGDKALMSPESLMMVPAADYDYHSLISSGAGDHHHRIIPMFGSDDLAAAAGSGFQCWAISEAASITRPPEIQRGSRRRQGQDEHDDDEDIACTAIKAKIVSHPRYPKLLDAYIDCQKVGAPPEIARLLEEIRRENGYWSRDAVSGTCFGADPELDEFMETYCDVLVKYKSDLSKPFDEAATFLNNMQMQLRTLSKDDGSVSSDDDYSGGETVVQDIQMKNEDGGELKERLLRKYGNHITTLKMEFSKKKKKGKLPKEARQILLEWWNLHYKWPYPTDADKILLAESTGLDQKQINNWFINQRKRHWKPSENMHLAVMANLSGQFFADE